LRLNGISAPALVALDDDERAVLDEAVAALRLTGRERRA
jgi:hypothetical protein